MVFNAIINGLRVEAIYSEENVQEIFLPLLRHLTALQREKGSRVLALLAAPPGAGKTTLLQFLRYLSEQTPGLTPVTTIGMDGFHHYQTYLESHTMVRDGQSYLMKEFKGAPETFDLPLLRERLGRVAAGEVCGWPEYYRIAHDPVDNAVLTEGEIILLEGNYLLLDRDGWRDLPAMADYTIKIIADEDMLFTRLIDRKAASGIPREEAGAFVRRSDLVNVRTCLRESLPADLTLTLLADGSYRR